MSGDWAVERLTGSAAELHHRPLGPVVTRAVTVLHVPRTVLVLGSTQPDSDVDALAASTRGVEVARRRSGGGAVLPAPDTTLWVDVDLSRDDALWDDDIGRATHWLGAVWSQTLGALGITADVHTGAMVATRWSRLVCFGGVGPGEVLADGKKLVGLSQRRTRAGARFQCVVHRVWDPRAILGLLVMDDDDREAARTALEAVAGGVDLAPASLADALASRAPRVAIHSPKATHAAAGGRPGVGQGGAAPPD